MFVCCECCVLSGRRLCDELITRPEESYRLWCVVVCDQETSRMRRPWLALGRSATENKQTKQTHTLSSLSYILTFHAFPLSDVFLRLFQSKQPCWMTNKTGACNAPCSLDVLAHSRNFWYSPTLSSSSSLVSSTPTTITVTHSSVAYIEKDIISVFQRLFVLGSVVARWMYNAAGLLLVKLQVHVNIVS